MMRSNGVPSSLPPAFMDEMYLEEVEERAQRARESEDGHNPLLLDQILLTDVPALIAEIRHLRRELR